jgi:hypothetical protein
VDQLFDAVDLNGLQKISFQADYAVRGLQTLIMLLGSLHLE